MNRFGRALVVGALVTGVFPPTFAADRFTLMHNGEAVRDARTGLVWEREPDREHDVWSRSLERCATKEVGGQRAGARRRLTKSGRWSTLNKMIHLCRLDIRSSASDRKFFGPRPRILPTTSSRGSRVFSLANR